MTLATLLKMVLMLLAMFGITAPAATATKPAIRAYSIKSWAVTSFRRRAAIRRKVEESVRRFIVYYDNTLILQVIAQVCRSCGTNLWAKF